MGETEPQLLTSVHFKNVNFLNKNSYFKNKNTVDINTSEVHEIFQKLLTFCEGNYTVFIEYLLLLFHTNLHCPAEVSDLYNDVCYSYKHRRKYI